MFARLTGVRKLFGRRQGISRCWMLSVPYVLISKPECVEVNWEISHLNDFGARNHEAPNASSALTTHFNYNTPLEVNVNDYGLLYLFSSLSTFLLMPRASHRFWGALTHVSTFISNLFRPMFRFLHIWVAVVNGANYITSNFGLLSPLLPALKDGEFVVTWLTNRPIWMNGCL